jgi:broad specificity phosphatase PhoE
MRYTFIVLLLAFNVSLSFAQTGFERTKTKIYLVRHGEKETGKDPVLTPAGRQRAGDLLRALKDKGITHIYSTPYKRTQMTGDSLRIQLGIDTLIYAADTMGVDLISKIKSHNDIGKTILVIGHSNTIPALIRHLGITDFAIKELDEREFDNLFLINYKKKKPKLKSMKYGAASSTSAAMQKL